MSHSRRLEVETDAIWFGSEERPALGWLSRPAGGTGASAVLVLPPVGYPYWSSHRTLRVLAERLAAQGHVVLRIDYDATGDSAGDQWEPGRVAAWRETVRLAAACLRERGVEPLTLLGARLGATFALLEAGTVGAERIVAWAPVLSGRRYAKELRLLSIEVPAGADPTGAEGSRVLAGSVFSAQTLAEISSLSLDEAGGTPAAELLVLDEPGEAQRAAQALSGRARALTVRAVPGGELALGTPAEFATVPEEIVAEICRWVGGVAGGTAAVGGRAATDGGTAAMARVARAFRWRDGRVQEEVVTLEPGGHVAVLTRPAGGEPPGATLVLLNPGSESHVGPGRAWVELARDLAARGHRCARVDFLGWGESPDAGRAPGRPYDATGVQDAALIAAELEQLTGAPVVLFGLCASAWIALRTVLEAPVAGAIALNPQMYWKPGDPVDIDWQRIRERRAAEIARVARGAELGLWSALDAAGHRPRIARWLEQLAGTGRPVELLFSEGDDGLRYLSQRAGRRLGRLQRDGALVVRELRGLDHPLHRTWARALVADAVHEALARFARRLQ